MNQIKQRVCHVIDHMGLGGAQTIVRDLVDRNESNYVFALSKKEKEVPFQNKTSKNRFFCSKAKSKYSIIKQVLELKKIVKENNIEILHAHLIKSDLIVYLLLKLNPKLNIKFVFHEHSAILSDRKTYVPLVNLVRSKVNAFISVSKECKENLVLKTKLNDKQIKVIYNYAYFGDLTKLSDSEKLKIRKEFKISKDNFVIGSACRLRPYKRVSSIIKAYQILNDKNIHILVAGEGEDTENLKELANGDKNIHFLGFRTDMKDIYQTFDVFVLASKSEGNPMTFFESQAYNVPFIGSDINSILEVVEDEVNGLIFEFDNEQQLAKQIEKIYKNKALAKKLTTNGAKTLKQFDIDIFERNINKVYNTIL